MISVIIPVDKGYTINHTLDSLNKQTNKNFEVITVNYGNSAHYFYDFVTTFRSDGINNAKNVGVHYAKYDKIVFLNEDMVVPPCWIDSIINIEADADAYIGPVHLSVHYIPPWWLSPPINSILGEYSIERKIKGFINEYEKIQSVNVVLTKDIIAKLGGFNSTVNTDYYFCRDLHHNYNIYYDTRMSINKLVHDYQLNKQYLANQFYNNGYSKYITRHIDDYSLSCLHEPYWAKYSKKFKEKGNEWFELILSLFDNYKNGYNDCYFGKTKNPPFKIKEEPSRSFSYSSVNDCLFENNVLYDNSYYDLIKFNELPKVFSTPAKSDKALCMIAPDEMSQKELAITKSAAKKYADYYKFDYIELLGPSTEHKCGHKYAVNQITKEYQETLYIDCDVVIMPDSPNVFDCKGEADWALFNETNSLSENVIRELKKEIGATMDCMHMERFEINEWYNGGVMILPNNSHEIYFPPHLPVPNVWCIEQHWLNIMLNYKKARLHNLDIKWNTGFCWLNFPELIKDAYFIHMNGCPHPLRLEFLEFFTKNNRKIPEQLRILSEKLKHRPAWS